MRSADIVVAGMAWLGIACTAPARDWVSWRGPGQNGASQDAGLPPSWSPAGENLVWKAPIGGRSTPVVMNGRVYVFTNVGEGVHEQERVVCLDAGTGVVIWEHRFPVFLTTQTREVRVLEGFRSDHRLESFDEFRECLQPHFCIAVR